MAVHSRTRAAAAILMISCAGAAVAAGPRSSHYSYDYAATAASGAAATTGNYSVVSQVTTKGIAPAFTASLNGRYSIAPVVGTTTSQPNSAVTDWSLY